MRKDIDDDEFLSEEEKKKLEREIDAMHRTIWRNWKNLGKLEWWQGTVITPPNRMKKKKGNEIVAKD